MDRPRLSIFRSHRHIACQIIDDVSGKTIVAVSTAQLDARETLKYGGNKSAAEWIGQRVAEKAIAAGIKEVMFDRGHMKYHGRIAALANAARNAGLSF